jgi:hypothetical protein
LYRNSDYSSTSITVQKFASKSFVIRFYLIDPIKPKSGGFAATVLFKLAYRQLPKLHTRVRFPPSAPVFARGYPTAFAAARPALRPDDLPLPISSS